MKVTASQIAALIGGTVEGNPNAEVLRPMRIEEAGPGDFAFFDHPKYESYAYSTDASVLLVSDQFQPQQPVKSTLVRVADVRGSLAMLLEHFSKAVPAAAAVISPQSVIDASATIGKNTSVGHFTVIEANAVIARDCVIHPQAYIGRNVRIGTGTVLHSGVKIYDNTVIGDHCTLHANVVVGSDGFGYAPLPDGSWKKVPHVGNVIIENDVEIGANSTIDRAAMGSTLIGKGVKLDNLVHIAHNVEVGAHTAMAAQVGIAGSAKIGPNCMIGGQTGIAGHISLAKGTRTQAQSGVGSSTKQEGIALFGSPAIPYNDYVKAYIIFKQLPDLDKKVRQLEKKLAQNSENKG